MCVYLVLEEPLKIESGRKTNVRCVLGVSLLLELGQMKALTVLVSMVTIYLTMSHVCISHSDESSVTSVVLALNQSHETLWHLVRGVHDVICLNEV